MTLNSSDLVLRATSVEVVGAGNCNVVGASSLLLLLLLGMDDGAVGGTMGVVERGIK